MLFSHGYNVDCWNRWLCLSLHPFSGSLCPCASLKPHGSVFISKQTLVCPPKVAALHTCRCPPEAGPNSPGPCRLDEPQVKWCK